MSNPVVVTDSASIEYGPLNPYPTSDFGVFMAIKEIEAVYGDVVSVAKKNKSLLKFGENLLVGTTEAPVMTLPTGVTVEPSIETNGITHVSSADASDTQALKVEGHTISGTDITFVIQEVTLNGRNKVALTTPLRSATRAENLGSTDFAGIIYVYEDDTVTNGVPDTNSKVHLMVPVGENQTLKASTSISSTDYALITTIYASVNEKTSADAVIRVRVRSVGGVFKTKFKRGIHSTGSALEFKLDPPMIVPKNSDISITATADGANTPISAGFNSYLAKVIS